MGVVGGVGLGLLVVCCFVCLCVFFSPEVVGGVVVCGNFFSMCFFLWKRKMTTRNDLNGMKVMTMLLLQPPPHPGS